MPREVTIDGLYVDDSNHPDDYQGMYLFSDPDGGTDIKPEDRPFPYTLCQRVKIRALTTASGKKPRVSPNAQIEKSIILIEDD
jgi:hypothetical protein